MMESARRPISMDDGLGLGRRPEFDDDWILMDDGVDKMGHGETAVNSNSNFHG